MRNKQHSRKLLVGVTGGIGSGKSLVCEYFQKCGGEIFYADKIARDQYITNIKLRNELVKNFGNKILDENNQLSLPKFREIVFKGDANQKRVNRIVHPFVVNEILIISKKSNSPLVFIEAALIFESGFDKYLDYTIEVFATVKNRIKWVKNRSKLSIKLIRSIMKLQMPEREKLQRADFVIKNELTKAKLKKQVMFLYGVLKEIAG